jgi:predicted O-linked N-acetylglucosamine transferase (SPINDLY family)
MARLALADLALDTAPCNSHTTASDALWMGVPLLTLSGRSFDARVGASLLHAVGLPEFVAHDEAEYASLLDALLREPQRLAQARRRLIEGRTSARLWDAPASARALERAYTAMYQRFREGKSPAAMDLDDAAAA